MPRAFPTFPIGRVGIIEPPTLIAGFRGGPSGITYKNNDGCVYTYTDSIRIVCVCCGLLSHPSAIMVALTCRIDYDRLVNRVFVRACTLRLKGVHLRQWLDPTKCRRDQTEKILRKV